MNLISLVRNDDRLIHGQCMVRLVQHFKLSRIIVVDDMTATNSILKMVFEKAAMPGMTINVYTHENCIEPIKAAIVDNVSTMVVFRFIPTFVCIYYGQSAIEWIVQNSPQWLIDIMTIFGNPMCLVGFAILLKLMVKKPTDLIYFTFGFALVGALGADMITVLVFALVIALLQFQIGRASKKGGAV
jgi:mannose/fructose/N-acetylgalactosamine-specific phosphotransferase system component IIC